MDTSKKKTWTPVSTSFVGFYESNNISPVSQDISNLKLHFQRRESLLRSLGILPSLIAGSKVLEFGPGSGHNSLYLASLEPAQYDLVEGNLKGVNETRLLIGDAPYIKIIHALFDDYKSSTQYQLVWAEGCLPHQRSPIPLLAHVASFVVRGGNLFIHLLRSFVFIGNLTSLVQRPLL